MFPQLCFLCFSPLPASPISPKGEPSDKLNYSKVSVATIRCIAFLKSLERVIQNQRNDSFAILRISTFCEHFSTYI